MGRRKVGSKGIIRRRLIVISEGLILLLPIQVELLVYDLDAVARHSDDPLNVIWMVLIRKLEDDYVAPRYCMTPIVRNIGDESIIRGERGQHGLCGHCVSAAPG